MGHSVVTGMTLGFVIACLAGVALAGCFAAFGFGPIYAIAGFIMPIASFYGFQWVTWRNVAKYPDPSVTGGEDYAATIIARQMGAKFIEYAKPELPVAGATGPTVPESGNAE